MSGIFSWEGVGPSPVQMISAPVKGLRVHLARHICVGRELRAFSPPVSDLSSAGCCLFAFSLWRSPVRDCPPPCVPRASPLHRGFLCAVEDALGFLRAFCWHSCRGTNHTWRPRAREWRRLQTACGGHVAGGCARQVGAEKR